MRSDSRKKERGPLPFTHEAFLEVFAQYNTALWPAVAAMWIFTAVVVVIWLRRGRVSGQMASGLLAVHWAWSAIAYHWLFFRAINPAATLFAALFLLQAAFFIWLFLARRGIVVARSSVRELLGAGLALYGLVYPLLGLVLGLRYPRFPIFAVPCPTTLITAGLLVASRGWPRFVRIVPILWAGIGSTAAFALGIRADLALVLAGVVLTMDALWPSDPGTEPRT